MSSLAGGRKWTIVNKCTTMLAHFSTIILSLALVVPCFAAPASHPMLQVGEKAASSYAESGKRANFETDPMLQVGEKSASSYAESDKRANFETDPMLQVGEKAASSYAENTY
ncbi:hypothetical protein VP1G_05566 [Cytospora mali]|uniref:Uncharacterized protein n=1 Tax=Cytospora mali TaxID=578113 RepID=A0A194V2Z3_CYTMA|nr:hypothetical protein VP1G_05566 [Valsa mali var. pyri (nom. inval.)]